MKSSRSLLYAILSLAATSAAAGEVSVSYLSPEKYQDIGLHQREIDRNLRQLEEHLHQMGKQLLPAGQNMKIEILDIDLAGRYESLRLGRTDDIRVLKAADWPRIKLRYQLSDGHRVLQQGEESISDINYLERVNSYLTSDPLRYEKLMLEDWFKARIKSR